MTIEEMKNLIQNGEKIDVEFKESKETLTKDVFDSVCSFNNRNGGHIFLGVSDKKEIIGVNENKIDKIIKEFTTSINNSQKIYPPLYLVPLVVEIDEKIIVYIRVPKGYQVCRHNGKIWDRSYEGDINITDNSIMSVLPQHKTDAIFRVENKDRYDDRDVIITNLIDSYDRLISFGQKHLNDLFVLDGILNVNARDRILREIVSNTLAHRDYSSGFPAKMIIDGEKIIIENSNLAHSIGTLDLQKFEPFPKNPSISKIFREIGLADELGSGMRNTYKYTQLYSGMEPIFEEGNIFKTIIPLKEIATEKVGGENVSRNVPQNVSRNVPQKSIEEMKEIMKEIIKKNNRVSRKYLAEILGVSEKTITRYIKEIPNLSYIGKGKNGYWKLDEE